MVERGKPGLSVGEGLFAEDDLIMVSALQHYLFCPRRCALIHLEQQWLENRLTAEGRILHERVHTSGRESRRTLRVEYDVPIRSLRFGLVGFADVVEFHRQENGFWQPLPVEYKRGRPKKDDIDRVQLCAQALCLEEQTGRPAPMGEIFYYRSRHRIEVPFTPELRGETEAAVARAFALLATGALPAHTRQRARCDECSIEPICLPKETARLLAAERS